MIYNSLKSVPSTCAVVGCSKRGDRDHVKFFRLPKIDKRSEKRAALSKSRQKRWLAALKRDDLKAESFTSTVVCSRHFITGRSADLMDDLNPDWTPTLHLGYTKTGSTREMERYNRVLKRNLKKDKIASVPNICNVEEVVSHQSNTEDEIMSLKKELENVKKDLRFIKAKQQPFLACSLEEFGEDESKSKYFTGLNYKTLKTLYQYLEPYLPEIPEKQTKFQILVLTLTKLRLNLDFKLLGYISGISVSSVSRYFHKCIYVMFKD